MCRDKPEQADAEHAGPPCRKQVPDRIADDVALLRRGAEPLGAGEKEIGLGLRALDVPALDHDGLRAEPERFERCVDLRAPAGGRDSEAGSDTSQLRQELDRFGKRASFGEQLAE